MTGEEFMRQHRREDSGMANMSTEEFVRQYQRPTRENPHLAHLAAKLDEFEGKLTGIGPEQTAPQIGIELEHLHKAVAHITDQVNALIDRIGPVMAPVNAGVLGETFKDQGMPMSPIATNLAGLSSQLNELAHRVQSARMVIQL